MASQTFTSGTVVTNAWFVDANSLVWGVFNGATTAALARTALGITTSASTVPTTLQGDILYASSANVLASLNKSTSTTRYLSNTGSSNNPAWAQIDLSTGVTGVLPITGITQNTAKLLGRTTASSGVTEEITVSSPLTLSAGVLTNTSGITRNTVVTTTSGTNIVVASDSGLNTTKRITISLVEVSTNGVSPLILQIGNSVGVNNTGYVSQAGHRAGEGTSTVGFVLTVASVAAAKYTGTITLMLQTTPNIWVSHCILVDGTGTTVPTMSAGALTAGFAGSIQKIGLTTVNGTDTFDNGSVSISYDF